MQPRLPQVHARAVPVDAEVAELGGGAVGARVHLPVSHDAQSQAGAQGDVAQVTDPAAGAVAILAQGGQVGVVVERDGEPQAAGQRLAQRVVVPGRQVGAHQDLAPLLVDVAGKSNADADDPLPL